MKIRRRNRSLTVAALQLIENARNRFGAARVSKRFFGFFNKLLELQAQAQAEGPMQAFGARLTQDEILKMMAFIETLKKK